MQVEIPSFCKTLKKRCNERNESYLRIKSGGDFTELAALEAMYHKTCHVSYIKHTYTKKQNDLAVYDVFINFDNKYFNPLIKSTAAVDSWHLKVEVVD